MRTEEAGALARSTLEDVWSVGGPARSRRSTPRFVSHQHSHPPVRAVNGRAELEALVAEFHSGFPVVTDTVQRQIAGATTS